MKYMVANKQTACALALFLKDRFGANVFLNEEVKTNIFTVIEKGKSLATPIWREVCDAFMAGRQSVVN